METKEGQAAVANLSADELAESLKNATLDPKKQFGKTIIVPVAVPGVGKLSSC